MIKYPNTQIFREMGKVEQAAPVKSAKETVNTFINNTGRYMAIPAGLGLGAGVGIWGVSEGIERGAANIAPSSGNKKDDTEYIGYIKLALSVIFIIILYKRLIK
jgi:hypothetical protein